MHFAMAFAAGLLFLPENTAGQSYVPEGYRLSFSEEFATLSLDPACAGHGRWATYWCKWGVRHLSGNNDQALKADPSYRGAGGSTLAEHGLLTHERTAGNTLKLYGRIIPQTLRAQYHGFPYVGGMISTERTHAQKYGYWEIRARLTNTSKGHHWAMWLLPQDGSWPPEIDLVEIVGKNPKTFYMNSHGDNGPLVWFSPDDPFGWHTWGFLWTPTDLVWYVDGVERHRRDNYINKPMYFLISPEIGNSWAGSPDSSTIWPMQAEVDYVRVYEVGSAPSHDATAPSIPTGLTAAAMSSSQIDLSWIASTDNVGVTRYDVYRGLALLGATENMSFSDTGLAGGTTYNYRVRACDAAENCSELSSWVSATTDQNDPPPLPGGDPLEIIALNVTTARKCAEVWWNTNHPADSLVEYGPAPGALNQSVYAVTLTTAHRLRLSALSAKTLYYFRVTSVNEGSQLAARALGTFKTHPNTKC